MEKKWMFKLGAPILALALVSACGTADNDDNAPGDNNAPDTETPDESPGNEAPDNEVPDNETPDNDVPENDDLDKNNGEPTAPEDGENNQKQNDDQNLE